MSPRIQEIESFEYPSRLKGYKPRHIAPWYQRHALLLIAFCAAVILFVTLVLVPAILSPVAKAQVLQLKNCRTNAECCSVYDANSEGHVQDNAITKGCN